MYHIFFDMQKAFVILIFNYSKYYAYYHKVSIIGLTEYILRYYL